jgi:hypothetical protein
LCERLAAFDLAGDLLEGRVACVGAMILQPGSYAADTDAVEADIDVEAGGKEDTTAVDMETRVVVHGIEDDGSFRTGCGGWENGSAEVCGNGSHSAFCLDDG